MKLETIKKDKRKNIIIGSMIGLSVVGCLTLTATRAKYRSMQNIKLANGVVDYKVPDLKLAIKVSEDGTTYKNSSTIPEGNYTLNTEKSKCRIPNSSLTGENAPEDNSVTIEYIDGKLNFLGLTKNDTKCYIYLDKKVTTPSEDTIVKLKVKNIKEGTPDFSVIATGAETEENNGVFITEDPMYGDNAKTYYWRGAATTNHVIFDNKCWRIVRINGDGTIRLVYNGTPSETACPGNINNADNVVLKGTAYNSGGAKSYYVGWTYISGSQRPSTNNPQTVGTAASLKTSLENWYKNNIINKNELTAGKFCNDRNLGDAPSGWDGYTTTWDSGNSKHAYAVYRRLFEGTKTPTLECSAGDVYKLDVGMITADEAQFAGASGDTRNESYYLWNGHYFWTMSPSHWNGTNAYVFYVREMGYIDTVDVNNANSAYGVRPVINLRSDVNITWDKNKDAGITTNPYIVQ